MKQMEKEKSRLYLSGKNGNGKYAIIDPYLKEILEQYSWHLNKGGYAKSSVGLMHRYIVSLKGEIPKNYVVDHLNGNRLDNRNCNLKVKSYKGNAKNRTNDPTDSGYTGVTLFSKWKNNRHNIVCKVKPKNIERFLEENSFKQYEQNWSVIHRGYIFMLHEDPRMCALCYDSIVTYCYREGKRINDQISDKPLPLSYWNLTEDCVKILDKFKSKHSDLEGVKKTKNGWKAFIVIDLGEYETDVEAHAAYKKAYKSFHGKDK